MAFEAERDAMVRRQIEARGLHDPRVLDALRRVPRHEFLPVELEDLAYADQAVGIGGGQTISQPYMVAAMTAALALDGHERVLEIGTGSAYQAAVLSTLAREVVSIERVPELAAAAAARLRAGGYANVEVIVADGTLGYAPRSPYDAILVTAGAPQVPAPLKEQLVDGGRLVIPVGPADRQELLVLTRTGDAFREAWAGGCVFVPLIGAHGWPRR